MPHRWMAMIALMFATAPAAAEDLVATLYSHNGSLPPPYHRSLRVEIGVGGTVMLRACKGYGDSDAACRAVTGQAAPGAVDAILAAAAAAGLPGQTLADDPMPPVGGGATSGSVHIGGQVAALPAFPVEADRPRAEAVLSAIRAAIPTGAMKRADKVLAE